MDIVERLMALCNPASERMSEFDRINAFVSAGIDAAQYVTRLRGELESLRKTAALLQQNAEGCAANHYSHDLELHGLPGWLTDTKTSIDKAAALLAAQ